MDILPDDVSAMVAFALSQRSSGLHRLFTEALGDVLCAPGRAERIVGESPYGPGTPEHAHREACLEAFCSVDLPEQRNPHCRNRFTSRQAERQLVLRTYLNGCWWHVRIRHYTARGAATLTWPSELHCAPQLSSP